MQMAAESEVGKAQLEDEDTNVFTGYPFGEDLDEAARQEAEQQTQDMMAQMGIGDMTEE